MTRFLENILESMSMHVGPYVMFSLAKDYLD